MRANSYHFHAPCLLLKGLLGILALVGCGTLSPPDTVDPILITLPAASAVPVTATVALQPATPTASASPTPVPTQPAPPSPAPQPVGPGSARQLWEWSEVARPAALAAAGERLAVLIADGRFAWVSAQTGRVEASAPLWAGITSGESWGEVYVDGLGTLGVAAIREQSINPQTGLADSRARLAVYDAQASELWSLPPLESQHFYSAALTSISVVVGMWPAGFADNSLTAYELYTGQQLWSVTGAAGEASRPGYQQILHDGNRLYVLVRSADGGAVVSYDLRTGEEMWRWSDPEIRQPDLIALGRDQLYVLSVAQLRALNPVDGGMLWGVDLLSAPEAGLGVQADLLVLAPAPGAEQGFRPGVLALYADGHGLAWHSLRGLLADPVTARDAMVWAIVKDYDTGSVALSGLDSTTGLEQVRMPVSSRPDIIYQIVVADQRIYVLGESLQAFGY